MTALVAAIDGGGSKTAAVWADAAGNLWRTPTLDGCNPQDNPQWGATLKRVFAALPGAPDHQALAHVTLGLPGYGEVAALDRACAALVQQHLPVPSQLLNDVRLAHTGAFVQKTGVLLLAGTGSMAMAGGPDGVTRVGGWGDLIGDEGSASWIGRAALSVASQMLDGRQPDTGFAQDLMARLGPLDTSNPFALMAWLYAAAHPRSKIASVAVHVDAMAADHDATAMALLHDAALLLAQLATTAVRIAGLPVDCDWSVAGSVFRSQTVLQAVTSAMGRPPVPPRLSALGAGLWLSARAAGWAPDDIWIDRISRALCVAPPRDGIAPISAES